MSFLLVAIMAITGGLLHADSSADEVFHVPIDGQLPYFLKQDITPIWDLTGQNKKDLIALPEFRLESHLGGPFTDKTIAGKVAVLNFFFASCAGYCPAMTRNIKIAFDQTRGNKAVLFASFSVTPAMDTKENLGKFADKFKINKSNWHLVRGDREVIYDLARNHLFSDLSVDLSKDADQFVHSESVYLIDQEGYLRGIYNGNVPRSMKKMLADMQLLGLERMAAKKPLKTKKAKL